MMRNGPHPFFLACLLLAGPLAAQEGNKALLAAHLRALPGVANDAGRDSLNHLIKRDLRALLEAENAFTADFDSVPISRVDAPDGLFRLFTWNLPRPDGTHHYEGLLLVRQGKRRAVHELRDQTPAITAPESSELGPERWYGALYYQVVPVKRGGRTWYTLLGWKGHSRVETRKVVEVLHFRGGQPRFGAPLFPEGRVKAQRKVYGYSHQATMMLRHDAASGRIVLDHLSPARADMEGQRAFYGPDLSYDAYVWDKDHWRFERDIDARDQRRDGKPFNAPPPPPKP